MRSVNDGLAGAKSPPTAASGLDDSDALTPDELVFAQCSARACTGCREAQFKLGTLYECGQGVKTTNAKAAYWFREAAMQGCPRAQNALGLQCAYAGVGLQQDMLAALEWLEMSCENGNKDASSNLVVVRVKRVKAESSE